MSICHFSPMTHGTLTGYIAALSACGVLVAPVRAQHSGNEFALHATQVRVARLAPDVLSTTSAFGVDSATRVTVSIAASGGDLTTAVVAPNGTLLTAETVQGYGGLFEFCEGPETPAGFIFNPCGQPGFHYLYTFPCLGSGTYTVHFDAAPGLSDEVGVITQLITDSPVRCNLLATESVVTQGSTVALSAFIFEGAAPPTTATVTVSLRPPQGDDVVLPLLDNGIDADDAVGDGLYSGLFEASAVGDYVAVAQITGLSSAGTPFTRMASTQVNVVPQHATLSAWQFTHYGVDTNGNGLFERLAISKQISVITPGNYIFTVLLSTAQGKALPGYGTAVLSAGTQIITAYIEADAILVANENGPFTITEAEVVYVGDDGAEPADRMWGGTQLTSVYLLSQFEGPEIRLGPTATSDFAVDTNGDGLFDRLTVNVGIAVRTPGTYQYIVRLTDSCQGQIQFLASEQSFSGGGVEQLELNFDGLYIGLNGVDGPYAVHDLLICGPSASLATAAVTETQAYGAADFVNFHAAPDCNANDIPDACDILQQTSQDCDRNTVPDECEPDCNDNDVADACDITSGVSHDCNGNGAPDECDIASAASRDCNSDGIPDECQPPCPCPGWNALYPPGDLDGAVRALAEFDDASGPALFVAGGFTHAGGLLVGQIAKWDGVSWAPLVSGTNGAVRAMIVYNGALIVGGDFSDPGSHLAKWNGMGWASLGSGTNGTVWALAEYNGTLVAGGDFASPGNHVATWDGTSWTSFGNWVDARVRALAVYNGELVAAGDFTNPVARIAKWNGTNWVGLGTGTNGPVHALTVHDGALIAGGAFTTAGGVSANRIAKWNGTTWAPLGSGFDGTVKTLATFDADGPGSQLAILCAGGFFTTAGGQAASCIATWNGTEWAAVDDGMGPTGASVLALTVFNDAIIPGLFAGGDFLTAGGTPASGIAAWHDAAPAPTITQPPTSQNVPIGATVQFTVSADGFAPLGYQWHKDGQILDDEAGHISGTTTATLTISAARSSDAGSYTVVVASACGATASASAMLHVPLPGDLNCDRFVNNFDINPFILAVTDPAAYYAAYPECDIMNADCNGDGYANNFDINAFIALLSGG